MSLLFLPMLLMPRDGGNAQGRSPALKWDEASHLQSHSQVYAQVVHRGRRRAQGLLTLRNGQPPSTVWRSSHDSVVILMYSLRLVEDKEMGTAKASKKSLAKDGAAKIGCLPLAIIC